MFSQMDRKDDKAEAKKGISKAQLVTALPNADPAAVGRLFDVFAAGADEIDYRLFVCAAADVFKGTAGSSFSETIVWLRRARGVDNPADELYGSEPRTNWLLKKVFLCNEARDAAHDPEC